MPRVELPKTAAIDMGSTGMKFACGQLDGLSPIADFDSRVDYASIATVERIGDRPIKHISASQLLEPLSTFTDRIVSNDVGLVVVTGLTHTLVVHPLGSGIEGAKIILSDPAFQLRPEDEPSGKIQPTSANMKVRALRRYPEVINHLLGTGTVFEDLEFNSSLGAVGTYMSERIFPSEEITGIPLSDLRSFAGGHGKGIEDVRRLREDVGLKPEQLIFHENPKFDRGGTIIYFVNDFEANAFMVEMLINTGQIPRNSIVVETDTVGKVMADPINRSLSLGNPIGNLMYLTQRRTAGINSDVLLWMITSKHLRKFNYTRYAEEMVREGLKQPNNPYYYFPDAYSDQYPYGRLIWWNGKESMEIPLHPGIANIYEKTAVAEMVAGIARGTCFGLRQKIEKIAYTRHEKLESVPIYIYGGLAKFSRGFKRLFAQCIPNDIYYLLMPGTSTAAAIKACVSSDLLGMKDLANYKMKAQRISPGQEADRNVDRSREYMDWLRLSTLI